MDLLGELNSEGLSVVLVTHDTELAQRADRVLTMEDGRITTEEEVRAA